ncbi:unnamed protein product [Coregonus sp. 'balchen']|nr:unnamed protein product [Coregonus sp. 'balchen']
MQPPLPLDAVRELVCSCLHRDPVAADLRCSLFVAAAQNYKRDSVLRPYPPRYIRDTDTKDFDELLSDVSSLPGVRELVRLRPGEADHHLALTHWVLSSKSFAVKTLQKDELEYCDQMNAKFEKTRAGRDLLYAFHGSRLENFHSIIHNGLHCHLNKTSLFGEGTYLTSDLGMAVLYSPHGNGWRDSLLGPLLSCVAMCEVIDHPDVKCQVKRKDSETIDRQRSRARNSEGGEVPQKHSRGRSWPVRHHFAIMMSLYLLLLIFIGAFNSTTFLSFWNRLFR